MRPLPVILLFVALACALTVGLLFVGRGDKSVPAASASATRPAADADGEGEAAAETPSLDATGAMAAESARAAPEASRAPGAPASVSPTKKGAPTALLTGRVLGNLGKPIEGATVYAAEASGFFGMGLDEFDTDRTSWFRRAEAKTDAEGRFEIRPELGQKFAVAVRAPGFAPLDREFTRSGATRDLGDLALDASVVLSGRVLAPNGRAIEGARIARVSGSGPLLPFFGGPRGATLANTDAQGAFRVDQLAAGPWRLLVTHDDHPDHLESGETDRPGTEQGGLVFTLEEGFEIQGRVVGAPAGLLPKLSVRASARESGEDAAAATEGTPMMEGRVGLAASDKLAAAPRTARCAADGSFTLKGLKRAQKYRLTAQESVRDFFRGARSVPVTAGAGDRGVELPFKPETALVFQVVDAASGEPVVDLSVQAGWSFTMPLLDENGRAVRRFPEGRVRYGGLAASPQSSASGIVPAGILTQPGASTTGLKLRIESAGYQVLERADIAVAEGQDTDLGILRLERAPSVTVLVLDDATGAPIAEASVGLAEEEENGAPGHRSARFSFSVDEETDGVDAFLPGAAQRAKTGADGRAVVTSLPGKTVRLSVRRAGYARYRSEPIELPLTESIERTVRLSVGGSVTVEVVDARGAAISGAEIEHQAPEGGEGGLLLSNQNDRTDAEGRLVFDHLASGVHRFRLGRGSGGGVFETGSGHAAVVRKISRVGGAEEEGWSSIEVDGRTPVTVRLVAPERGTLAGRVSEGGKPLANATLRLSPKSEEDTPAPFRSGGRSTQTDVRGDYLFDGVDEDEYTLSVEHATRAMAFDAHARVRSGENRLDLDLPVAIVEGTVTGDDGKPVAGVRVRAERAPSAGGGRRAMSIMVMATSDGGEEPEVSVDTMNGASPTVATDADGRYSLRGVLPDVELVVEADAKDAQPARSGKFTVELDQVKKGVDLKLERGGTLVVSVQHPDGKAAGGFLARATLDGGDSTPKVQMIGPGGSSKFTGMKPGKWRVNLDSLQGLGQGSGDSGEAIPEREVEVAVGETAKLVFEVP